MVLWSRVRGRLDTRMIWFHRYELVPRRALSALAGRRPRQGALLRVDDGFADLHPWPELGDRPLDEQLAMLAQGKTTSLTRASLRLAGLDGAARARGVSLFEGLTIPESHWPGNDPPVGFDTIKIKGLMPIPPDLRVRIDFNAVLTPQEFLRIAPSLPHERIDFIEDPCPFEPGVWRDLRARSGLRLAYDVPPSGVEIAQESDALDVLVHKPARNERFPVSAKDVVVTSAMDHPVGQFGAAYVAATQHVEPRCGLMTHVLYEPNAFIGATRVEGARLLPPEGTGIGFDDLLEKLSWTKLI
jgi:o-succinylbenzoate synthase